MNKFKKYLRPVLLALLLCALCCAPAFAASSGGSGVADVVEKTWKDAAGQIKTVVDNVVFPALDMILASPSSARSVSHTSTTKSTASSSGRAR